MISLQHLSIQIGARTLMSEVNLQVHKGAKIGLVGRNGAGKTTLLRAMAGLDSSAAEVNGTISRGGKIGYLTQNPEDYRGEPSAKHRILSARDLDGQLRRIERTQREIASEINPDKMTRLLDKLDRQSRKFEVLGGWAGESEAMRLAANLGLNNDLLAQPLDTLSGGQRRRVELARVLFSNSETLLFDEPTNHLDSESIEWLRGYLNDYSGGFVVISHSEQLLRDCVNEIWHLDCARGRIEDYHLGWDAYLKQVVVDVERRQRQREQAEREAARLHAQGERLRYKATKAAAAQQMLRRAEELLAEAPKLGGAQKVAAVRFPEPQHCGRVLLEARGLTKSFNDDPVFIDVSLAVERGTRMVVLGDNGAGKTTLLRILADVESADEGEISRGYGLKIGYYAQQHETVDKTISVYDNMVQAAPQLDETQVRSILGQFLFSGDDVYKPAGVLSGGEISRLALAMLVVSGANLLLLDEPTNNLDPATRGEILAALTEYRGAVVLVSHDREAIEVLAPQRVLVMPDGDEDMWRDEYLQLAALN
ncbi:MAG: ABC-F family ATP-binding cassette domain-containing protein [Varibaculum sp.]|nr:ABC-F family ATP-binding cassette domain-containing protein [Varibaculum sp.]